MEEFRVELRKSYFGEVHVLAVDKNDAEMKALGVWEDGEVEWENDDVAVVEVEQV